MNNLDFSNITCIATDLDGTLLDKAGRLSSFAKAMLEQAIANDYIIVIASGRPFGSMPEEVLSIPGISYAISSNGAYIYDVKKKELLKRYILNPEVVRKVIELTKDEFLAYEVFIEGRAYSDARYINHPEKFGASKQGVDYIRSTRIILDDIQSFILENADNIESLATLVRTREENHRFQELFSNNLDDVYITSSFAQLVEISDKQSGKHSGLDFIAKREGIISEHIIAFGNAENDIGMMQYAKYGFAVSNADEKCLNSADSIIPANTEDGVAQVLEAVLNAKKKLFE